MQPRGEGTVDTRVLTAHQRGDLTERGTFDLQVEIAAAGVRIPAALEAETAEPLRGAVRARGPCGDVDLPIAGAGGRDVEVRLRQVEDTLGVAEFEVNAAVADLDGRGGAHHRRIHDGGEVP